jgi:hypothetical protein
MRIKELQFRVGVRTDFAAKLDHFMFGRDPFHWQDSDATDLRVTPNNCGTKAV